VAKYVLVSDIAGRCHCSDRMAGTVQLHTTSTHSGLLLFKGDVDYNETASSSYLTSA